MSNQNPTDAEKKSDNPAARKSRAEKAEDETPAWQLPDYAGPLDIAQAQWRLRHIKPVREVTEK